MTSMNTTAKRCRALPGVLGCADRGSTEVTRFPVGASSGQEALNVLLCPRVSW